MAVTIKHLVVLMMENRSFDHMFGYLDPEDDEIDDLSDTESNRAPDGKVVLVSRKTREKGLVDPGHKFLDVNEQIFGTSNPQPGDRPTMGGFVKNYATQPGVKPEAAGEVMKCFAPEAIPVLTTLAREFALGDAWFSSVPGPTLPNRAFAHCASSNGSVDNQPLAYLRLTTVYERLDEHGVASKVYAFDGNTVALSFPYLLKAGTRFLGSWEDFLNDVKKGTLPKYCFIEPRYNNYFDHARQKSYFASDQHPPHAMEHGENLIADVYEAIRKSELWQETLLVIVYDEHGGLYDHVAPPDDAVPPLKAGQPRPDILTGFNFTRLGLRVPAVFISPFIRAGTVYKHRLEHASLVATARKLFAPAALELTARDQAARTFEDVINLTTPRTDTPEKLDRKKPKASRKAPQNVGNAPLSDHQTSQVLTAYRLDELLPADKRILGSQPEFATLQDIWTEQRAVDFIRLVSQRARAHWKQS